MEPAPAALVDFFNRLDQGATLAAAAHVQQKLAACAPAQRPASRQKLLSFVRRVPGGSGAPHRAFVLDVVELAAALNDDGVLHGGHFQQISAAFEAQPTRETESMPLAACPAARQRLCSTARKANVASMSAAATVKWLCSQAFVSVPVDAHAVVDALLAIGAIEDSGSRLGYVLKAGGAVAAHADTQMFHERELCQKVLRRLHSMQTPFFPWHFSSTDGSATSHPLELTAEPLRALGLDERLSECLQSRRIVHMSRVQCSSLHHILSGRDVIVQAMPGSGKTTTASITALSLLDFTRDGQRVSDACLRSMRKADKRIPSHGFEDSNDEDAAQERGSQEGCSVCGCSSEFDSFGDRVCWCDACWKGCSSSRAPRSCLRCGEPATSRRIRVPATQIVILAPTRELAGQIKREVSTLGWPIGANAHACYGGTSVRGDIDALRFGRHVVVGNCGRLYDLISKRHLRLDHVKLLVLDEADDLLSGDSKNQVYDIFKCMPCNVQVICLSTRLPKEVVQTMHRFMREPVTVADEHWEGRMPLTVRHFFTPASSQKERALLRLGRPLRCASGALVFCDGRRTVDYLAEALADRFSKLGCLHAELDQKERELVMSEFRKGKTRILLCTPQVARGLDIPRVALVVNFDLPRDPGEYLIRAGRCGRLGRRGVVISLVHKHERSAARRLVEPYGAVLGQEAAGVEEVVNALFGPKGAGGAIEQ